ncbi:MAG: hypothetical protein HYT97_08440 [Elusimicrobia bacterium]|nr:hypothetical protein [Elusimicrobiota bacterium]
MKTNQFNNNPSWQCTTSLSMAVVFFYVQIGYGVIEPLAQSQRERKYVKLWEERRAAREKLRNPEDQKEKNENLPAKVVPPKEENSLISQLPALNLSILKNSIPKIEEFSPSGHDYSVVPAGMIKKKISLTKLAHTLPNWFKSVPLSYANLIDFYVPENWKANDLMIIHIQDAHENFDAQNNIARIIEALASNNPPIKGINQPSNLSNYQPQVVVGLEGSSGAMNFEPYRSFPDPKISKEVAGHLLNESLISGAEYVGMTSKSHSLFWGAEDDSLYLKHIRALKDSIPKEKEAKLALLRYQSLLNGQKSKYFNPKLKELDQKISQYHSGKLGLGNYIKALVKDGIPAHMGMVKTFVNALYFEDRLDYDKIESEQRKLTQALTEKLTKPELDNLLKASLSHRLGNISYGDFYQYLTELCKAYGIRISQWPEMDKYVRYVLMSDQIRAEELFQEIGELEQRKSDYYILNSNEQAIVEISKDLALMDKLIEFKMSPDEWKMYQDRKKNIRQIGKRLNEDNAPTFLEPFEQFNHAAISRNSALVNNLLKKINSISRNHAAKQSNIAPIAVLVAGGFHTDGITELLKTKKVAFAVLAPKLGKVEGAGTDYLEIFRRDKTPLEKLFTGERITLKSPLPTAMTPPNGEISPVTYVVERKFSLFAAALLTRKILAQVTNLTRAQKKEIEKTLFTWIKEKGNQFQTLDSLTIDRIEEYRNKEGALEKIVVSVILHGKDGQKDNVVAVEVLSKDSQSNRGIIDADLLSGQHAVSKVGEDILTIYVPHPSILLEVKDVLAHKLPKLSNWVLERIRNRSLSLVRNVKDKVSGALVGSNDVIDSMKGGETRHLAALKTTTAEQFGNRWFIRLDGDMLGTLNLLYGKGIIGTLESEHSLFRESQEILKRAVIEEGGNLYMGEGADEIILEFEGNYATINKKLNNVIAKYTIAFSDRYAVLRIESRKLTSDQKSKIKVLDRVLVVAEHGNGVNILVNQEGLKNTKKLVKQLKKILKGLDIADITHTNSRQEIGFMTLTGGAVSFDTVIEYMAKKIFKDDDKKERESTLESIREELINKFESGDEDFLKLFYLIGMQLSDIAVGVAKYVGRNQRFVPKHLKELTDQVNAMDESKSVAEEQQELEGPEVTREMIENPAVALEQMKSAAKEEGKDSLTEAYTVGKLKELAIEGEYKYFGFFRILSFFKTLGRERAFHKWQGKVQHKGGDKTIITIAVLLNGNKAEIFFDGARVIIARQGADNFVIAYDTKVRGPPNLNKLLEDLTAKLKEIYPDVELEIVLYEVSMAEMKALKAREEFKEYQNQYKLLGMMEQIVESMATVGVDQLRATGLIVEQDGPIFIVRFDHTNFDQLMQSYRDAQDRLSTRAMKEMEDARMTMPSHIVIRDEMVVEKTVLPLNLWKKLINVIKGEEGTSTVEYGLILSAINPIGLFVGGVSLVVLGIVNLVKILTKSPSFPESVLLNNLLVHLPENVREPLQKDLSKGLLPQPEKLLNQIKSQTISDQNQLEQIIYTIHLIQMARIFSGTKGALAKGKKLEPQQTARLSRFLNSKELAQIELSELVNAYEDLFKRHNESKESTQDQEIIQEHFGYLATILFESGGANDLDISFESRWKAYQGMARLFNSETIFSDVMKDSAQKMWENGKRRKEDGSYSSRLIRTSESDSMDILETGTSGIELFNVDDLSSNGIKLLADRIRRLPSGKQIYLYSSKGEGLTPALKDRLIKDILDLNVDGVDSNRLKQIKFGEKQVYGTTDLTEIVTKIKALSKISNPLIDIFTERNVFKGTIQGLRIQIYVILSGTHLIEISKDLELIHKSREALALQQ